MPGVVRDGADLYWEKSGAGPALILGAGLNGSGTWWDPNRPALAERFTVYTFDQRGTGRSSKIPVVSIEQMAADLVAVMDDAGLGSAHYAGHSTGGGIGVATVLDFPGRLRSLLICCSTTCGDPYRQKLLGLRRRLCEELGGADVQASRLNAILAFDRRAQFHRITVPTLVLGADDDLLAPRYFSEEYIRLIPGARAHFARRGGHALTKTEADLFNRIVLKFFTELTA